MFERTSTHVRISKPQSTLAPRTRRWRISVPMMFINLCRMLVISSVLLFFLVVRPLRYCIIYSRELNLASARFQHESHEDDKKSSRGKIVRSMTSPPPYFSLSKVLSRRSIFRATPGRMQSEKRDKGSIHTRRVYLIVSVHHIRECPPQSPKRSLPHAALKWSRPCRSQPRFGTNDGSSAVLLISERSNGAYLIETPRIAVE